MADGVAYKPLVAFVDRRSQVVGGSWSHLQAFGNIRGSSCTSLLKPNVDRRVEAFGGIRGLSFASLWWLMWIAVHKPSVAVGAIYKPLVEYVDRCLQAFGGYFWGLQAFAGSWSRLQAFGGLRGSPFKSLWW